MTQPIGRREAIFSFSAGANALAFAAALVGIISQTPALHATTGDTLFTTGNVRNYFREVLRASLTATPDTERAAFIVRSDDGSLGCQLWPPMNRYHQEVFRGSVPAGTLAIIHTHPEAAPRPSVEDQMEANRLGIPIYVLTRRDVFKAEPGGRTATAIVRREWWLNADSIQNGAHCR